MAPLHRVELVPDDEPAPGGRGTPAEGATRARGPCPTTHPPRPRRGAPARARGRARRGRLVALVDGGAGPPRPPRRGPLARDAPDPRVVRGRRRPARRRRRRRGRHGLRRRGRGARRRLGRPALARSRRHRHVRTDPRRVGGTGDRGARVRDGTRARPGRARRRPGRPGDRPGAAGRHARPRGPRVRRDRAAVGPHRRGRAPRAPGRPHGARALAARRAARRRGTHPDVRPQVAGQAAATVEDGLLVVRGCRVSAVLTLAGARIDAPGPAVTTDVVPLPDGTFLRTRVLPPGRGATTELVAPGAAVLAAVDGRLLRPLVGPEDDAALWLVATGDDVRALVAADGSGDGLRERWRLAQPVAQVVALAADRAVVVTGVRVVALDARSGEPVWSWPHSSPRRSPCRAGRRHGAREHHHDGGRRPGHHGRPGRSHPWRRRRVHRRRHARPGRPRRLVAALADGRPLARGRGRALGRRR